MLDPAEECPAGMVADLHIRAAYDDEAGLARLAQQCRAVTTEFERARRQPARAGRALPRQPGRRCRGRGTGSHRRKTFIAEQGIPVAPHAAIRGEADLRAAPNLFPGILKVARMGYDGKGQARIATREALAAYAEFGGVPCVLEALMPLDYEISVVLARGFTAPAWCFRWRATCTAILAVSTASAAGQDAAHAERQARATAAAQSIAQGLGYHGVLCVEFFVLRTAA